MDGMEGLHRFEREPIQTDCHNYPQLSPERELKRANEITVRMCALLAAAHENGVEFIVENPADRGDQSEPNLYLHADHGSLWVFPLMLSFIKRTGARTCTFAQCMFGAPFQKYTTLMYSAGLAPLLDPLDRWRCTHSTHAEQVGGDKDENGEWLSARAAAYPRQGLHATAGRSACQGSPGMKKIGDCE